MTETKIENNGDTILIHTYKIERLEENVKDIGSKVDSMSTTLTAVATKLDGIISRSKLSENLFLRIAVNVVCFALMGGLAYWMIKK